MDGIPAWLRRGHVDRLPAAHDGPTRWQDLATGVDIVWVEASELWAALSPAAIAWILSDDVRFSAQPAGAADGFLLTSDGERHRGERSLFWKHFGPQLASAAHSIDDAARAFSKGERTAVSTIDLCRHVWRRVMEVEATDIELNALVANIRAGSLHDPTIERMLHDDGPACRLRSRIEETNGATVATERATFLLVAMTVALLQTLPGAAVLASHTPRREWDGTRSLDAVDELLARDTPLVGLFRFVRAPDPLAVPGLAGEDTPIQLCWLAANQRRVDDAASWTFGSGPHACPARSLSLRVIRDALRHGGVKAASPLVIDQTVLPHVRMPLL